jgi:two-component system sensor histidine kinase ComP
MKKLGLFTAVIAFACLQLWFLSVTFRYPVMGIDVKNVDGAWKISNFQVDAIQENLGLLQGDVLKTIDGYQAGQYFTLRKWRVIEQADSITVERKEGEFTVKTNRAHDTGIFDIYPLVGELISFFVAGLLYRKMWHTRSARFLSLVFLNMAAIFMSIGASSRGDILGKMFVGTLVMLLPVVFLHFLQIFLREKGASKLKSRSILPLYILIGIVFLVHQAFWFDSTAYPVYTVMSFITILFFVCGLSLNLSFLIKGYRMYRGDQNYVSTLIKTIWASLMISFVPVVCFSLLPQMIYGSDWIDSYYTVWLILFFPVSFAYLITSKQLYDIDIVLRRILLTTAISIVPSALVTAIVYFMFPEGSSVRRLTLLFIFTAAILSFLLYSLEYFSTRMESVMFPRKHQLQAALKKISKNLRSVSSFREWKDVILVDIVNTLQVVGGAVVFKYQDTIETISHGSIDIAEVEHLAESGFPEYPGYSCFEINRNEEYTSFLVMTGKKSNTMLGLEETQWLNFIITYLAVSLENIYLIRKLTMRLQKLASQIPNEQAADDFIWFRKSMFELQEKERVRIATDLHDTTMQDLFFLKRRLASIADKHMFRKEDVDQMNNLIQYVEIINTNLRQSCFELHPYLLQEIGLVRTIRKVIEQEAPICDFDIDFEVEGALDIEQRNAETKRHLFRIVQELLNNAKKHSQASKVGIRLESKGSFILLTYKDNGVGFEATAVDDRDIGSSGMGMEQLRSRVLYLNGSLDLQAGRGRGVKLTITLPMEEGMTA